MTTLLPNPELSSSARALVLAVLAAAVPLSAASAQSLPQVRITDDTAIRADLRGRGDVMMRPEVGTVLEMIDMEGDRYAHREGNWYLVLLPRDAWGFQRTGWISGDVVEVLPPVVKAPAVTAIEVTPVERPAAQSAPQVGSPAASRPAISNVAPPAPASKAPAMADMVLRFDFGRSDLTADARATLTEPAAEFKANARAFSLAVEGHADWIGNETFNEKLGLARAETVMKFLADQYQIPVEQMTIVSYGENQPAAPNTTKEGRAENRRVVVKVRR
jgi:outer membrane protein OmpA-like peptidoglycan-associated protein